MTLRCAVCGDSPILPPGVPEHLGTNRRWICHHCFSTDTAKRLMDEWEKEQQ